MKGLFPDIQALLWAIGILAGAVIIGLALHYIFFQIVIRLTKQTSVTLYGALHKHSTVCSVFLCHDSFLLNDILL